MKAFNEKKLFYYIFFIIHYILRQWLTFNNIIQIKYQTLKAWDK